MTQNPSPAYTVASATRNHRRYPEFVTLGCAEHNARKYSRDGSLYVVVSGSQPVSQFRGGRKVTR